MDGNLAKNWKKFKQRFELYMEASGAADKEDKMKACLLFHVIGEDALDVYNNVKFENNGDNMKLKALLEKFDQYYNAKTNQTFRDTHFLRVCKNQVRKLMYT